MDTRPPRVNDRVRLPGVHRLYTVRAAADGILTVTGPAEGDVRVVAATQVTVVHRAEHTDPRPEPTREDPRARER